ncbi:MAG: hypothetical protein ACRDY1_09830, partial [Acidimicrobiales bacterium]
RRADPPGLGRWGGSAATLAVVVALGAAMSACAGSAALGLVQQACHDVSRSLALYRSAQHESDPARAARERTEAEVQLQTASPLATEAAGQAPQWQPLMATLAETSRLPESEMIDALQGQCSVVQTGGTTQPALPVTTLPAPPGQDGTKDNDTAANGS